MVHGSWNGAGMELEWSWNGAWQLEWSWNGAGMELEWSWNGAGMVHGSWNGAGNGNVGVMASEERFYDRTNT